MIRRGNGSAICHGLQEFWALRTLEGEESMDLVLSPVSIKTWK